MRLRRDIVFVGKQPGVQGAFYAVSGAREAIWGGLSTGAAAIARGTTPGCDSGRSTAPIALYYMQKVLKVLKRSWLGD